MKLFYEVKKLTDNIGISHFNYASFMAKPELVKKLSELLEAVSKKYQYIIGQVGIETGSTRLVKKYMKGKVKPFKPDEWPEIITESHKLINDNHWIPVNTLIIGFPGEKVEDINKTIELVYNISEYKSFIVPLYFVPIGNLKDKSFFRTKDNFSEHWKLLSVCIRHMLKWSYKIVEENPPSEISPWKIWSIKKIIKYMGKRTETYLKLMDEGINPIKNY